MTITYKEFNEYIDSLAGDYCEENYDDFSDYCHECADSSEFSIYYGCAWALVNMIRMADYSILEDAEIAISDYIGELSINTIMTKLAYECIYQQLSLAIQEKMKLN